MSCTGWVRTIFQSLFEDTASTNNFLRNPIFNTSRIEINPLSANPTKWINTKTVHWLLPGNWVSMFDHFVGLAVKGLICYLLFSTKKDSGILKSDQTIVHLKEWMLVN